MTRLVRSKVSTDARKSFICDLPTEILHKILEHMPIQDAAITSTLSKRWNQMWSTLPHLVFDSQFLDFAFNYSFDSEFDAGVGNAARIINTILLQHTGPILGFHFMSNDDYMAKYLDPWIIFVSKHGIQKLTIHLPNGSCLYELPYGIMTCSSLTHLEVLASTVFRPSDCVKFPNLVSLELVDTQIECKLIEDTLILPMLETLKLISCRVLGRMRLVAPKLENLTIDNIDIENLNPIVTSIKHLSLDRLSLEMLAELFHVAADRLVLPQNLQTLKICALGISVEQFSGALILLRGSSNLYELDLSVAVEVDESRTTELFSYLSTAESHLNEAFRMIQKVRVR
ncbi:PREDICTED: F-box/FBD/LRR-repeat protein At1g13570-like isoform X2 [Nicotiana attenuata]|uniref:F-boxfbd/lrr-repeat protein n=3 Tax=Nicotiana attenuata TaxID=49451 RepID=A0A1J6I8S4_NICAT|nr:PREDICTED: F-box/FBD/LRR-repeat protein At1g13570-like isoform X2 [Nicotiana attenuata]OIS96943.1 f-boxfbd/lrr-repeat protein [Nicotiana attenuata]